MKPVVGARFELWDTALHPITNRELKQPRGQWQQKTSHENKHLGNGDYFVIIAFSSHPLLLTEHAANGLVQAPFK